jgi:hypothetical protein
MLLALLAASALPAVGEAQESKARTRTLRYTPQDASLCGVRAGVVYQPAADEHLSLAFDLYTPPAFRGEQRLPVVVFINGVGYRDLKDSGQYTGWARAAACEGLAAVTYQATPNRAEDDLDTLMQYLKQHQVELSIDATNVAWWACSDNVQRALPMAMASTRPYLRCAVFYYGMPEQLPPVIRPDLSLCIVKAGVDSPELNLRIDAFALQAAAANVDMTYIVHASARHAFDVTEDSVRTRDIIQDTLKFMRIQLSPQLQSESEVAAIERRARLAYFRSDWADMVRAYDQLARLRPDDGEAHYRLGYARIFLGHYEAAAPAFERAAELDFMKPSATYNVACCRSRLGDLDGALAALRQALEYGFENRALLKEDPDLANLRGDPRYAQLMKEWLERRTGGSQKP